MKVKTVKNDGYSTIEVLVATIWGYSLMSKLPNDCPARVIGARAIVHYAMPAEQWEYHELTGTDHGIDCSIELIEENE